MERIKLITKEVKIPKGMVNKIKKFLGLPHKTETYTLYRIECQLPTPKGSGLEGKG